MEINYKKLMLQINTFIFDVDGVLTNGIVTVFTSGELIRQMNVKDGYAIKSALNMGYKVCIISGGNNEGVRIRLKELGIADIYLNAIDKIKPYQEFVKKYNLKSKNILYMGDDKPDYHVMKKVGLACTPKDGDHEIKEISKYISHKKGGEGCVRDVIEQTMRVQGKWKI